MFKDKDLFYNTGQRRRKWSLYTGCSRIDNSFTSFDWNNGHMTCVPEWVLRDLEFRDALTQDRGE